MHGPGTRPGRMVLLTSGIVDERPRSLERSLSTEPFGARGTCDRLRVTGPGTLLSFERSGNPDRWA